MTDLTDQLPAILERVETQENRTRDAQRRYDNSCTRCMANLEPHPRDYANERYDSVRAYERRFTYDYHRHGEPNPVERTIEELTDERELREKEAAHE